MNTIWVFDSSSLIAIKSTPHATRPALFGALSGLIADGRIKFPAQVVREIGRREDVIKRWIASEKSGLFDPPTFDELRRVLAVAHDVIDSRKDTGEDEADPYVLASALHLREAGHDARIVTEELRDFPHKLSLNSAAGMLQIPSVPLAIFLRMERIL